MGTGGSSSEPGDRAPGGSRVGAFAGVFAWFVAAVVARVLDFYRVFVGDGEVVFAAGDAFYHARRAQATFESFPSLLRFDPCINFPDGAWIPHPPLLDWGTAAIARMFGETPIAFEWTAAWVPVLLSSLAVFPIHALGRACFDARVGRLAAAIYAALPICINYGQLGNFDHHALAGLVGAWLVVLYARGTQASDDPAVGVRLTTVLVLARLAMLLSWTGSLLYLLPGEAALMIFVAERRDAKRLRTFAWGALATGGFGWALASGLRPDTDLRPFTAVEFSYLHGLIYFALGVLGLLYAGFVSRVASLSPNRGRRVLVALGFVIALAALAIPGVRNALVEGLGFLSAADGYTETVVEQLPLFFGEGEYSFAIAHARMGGFAYLLPLVPIAFFVLGRRPGAGPSSAYLVGWSLLLCFLAFGQVRYAHDLAPVGCVAFAWWMVRVAERVGTRLRTEARAGVATSVVAYGIAVVLLLPTIPGFYGPVVGLLWHGVRGDLEQIDRALLSVAGSQHRFGQLVADSTPAEGRCSEHGEGKPGYGVVSHIGLGHALHYSGGRATPADPFGPYVGRENFASVQAFFDETREGRAVEILAGLASPYVATAADALERKPVAMGRRLHEHDGSFAEGVPALGRFRLVTEGPVGGQAMDELFGGTSEGFAPYKLFERVAGAELRVETEGGGLVTAELPLKTPSGRRFLYRVAVKANAKGVARFRVPYANPADRPRIRLADRVERVTALGPYAVEVAGTRYRVHVGEDDVRQGRSLAVSQFPSRTVP
ncbi:MAG: glycosyltransferase family 39 protein [Myxococcota bacterium]|jgi:hypothetical protein|nr:glycosyltransferase family 39 protein [Myxococcota bacterium]